MDARLFQHVTSLDARLSRREQRGEFQTSEIKAKFETTDLYAARTWGVVYEQQRAIREMKEASRAWQVPLMQ
jgi:hypothetical protein